MLEGYLSTTLYPAADKIFFILYILQARNLFMSSWRLLIYNFWEDNEGFVDQSLGG